MKFLKYLNEGVSVRDLANIFQNSMWTEFLDPSGNILARMKSEIARKSKYLSKNAVAIFPKDSETLVVTVY